MPPILGNLIVLAALMGAVALAIRSIWRDHKRGKSCSCGGDCARCKGCH